MLSHSHYFRLDALCFVLMGLLNNASFVAVISASKSLAEDYNAMENFGIIGSASVALGVFATPISALVSELSIPYFWRFWVTTIVRIAGLLMIAFTPTFKFCVAGVLVTGLTQILGENFTLCYVRKFDPAFIGDWSCGTGWAGVIGSFAYLTLRAPPIDWSNQTFFLAIAAIQPLFALCYEVLKRDESVSPLKDTYEKTGLISDTLLVKPSLPFSSILRILSRDGLALGLVYWLEYTIQGKFAREASVSAAAPVGWYEELCFIYQIGVLVSRSLTLPAVRWIAKESSVQNVMKLVVTAATILQSALFLLWMFTTGSGHYMPLVLQIASTVCPWLCCKRLSSHDKERAVNFVAMLVNLGVVQGAADAHQQQASLDDVEPAAECRQEGRRSVRGPAGADLLTVYVPSSDTVLHLDPATSTIADVVASNGVDSASRSSMIATPLLGMIYLSELDPRAILSDFGFMKGHETVIIGDHLVNDITIHSSDQRGKVARVPLFCLPGANLIWRWCVRHALEEGQQVEGSIAGFIVENRTVLDLLDPEAGLLRMWNGDAGPLTVLWGDGSSPYEIPLF
ncbi:hypothetical protein FOZ61_003545 [Perkinsus olseni]|uniref:Uncharacterized protein n=1 Tax=Perkinsus olseni TaxID=32597 RepID=A0A7J6MDD8_PEROL|nr:hypothetical protein FOZ61_003545 [Perkinsus olseni]